MKYIGGISLKAGNFLVERGMQRAEKAIPSSTFRHRATLPPFAYTN
jgi:hypothetical protein